MSSTSSQTYMVEVFKGSKSLLRCMWQEYRKSDEVQQGVVPYNMMYTIVFRPPILAGYQFIKVYPLIPKVYPLKSRATTLFG